MASGGQLRQPDQGRQVAVRPSPGIAVERLSSGPMARLTVTPTRRWAGRAARIRLAERREDNRRRMKIALAINVAMLVAAAVGGVLTGSLALLAEAGHVLSDVGAIVLALLAAVLAARSGGPRRTFGYQRTEVIAALVNGVTLVAIAVLVVVAAINRLGDPPERRGRGRDRAGSGGAGSETAPRPGFSPAGDRDDLNLEAVLRHSAADALGAIGGGGLGGGHSRDRLAGDRPAGEHRDRRPDPGIVDPARARAARRPDGGGAPGGGRRRDRSLGRLHSGRQGGARAPRLDGHARGSRRSRPTSSWPGARTATGPGARWSSCSAIATGSSTRRSRWRRRWTTTRSSRSRPSPVAPRTRNPPPARRVGRRTGGHRSHFG